VDVQLGLRERKKARTRRAISEAAIALFLERGYDSVSVAEIAAAAEVSKRTLFAYFPTKDDLVLHRFADHEDEPARVVRGRERGESPLDALHRYLLSRLDDRDPISGLCDMPQVVAFYRLVLDTSSLRGALLQYQTRGEHALASALLETTPPGPHAELTARLAAVQVLAALRTLGHENQRRISAGSSADELEQEARAAADHAFDLLRRGIAAYA
jgi:AcrR family transcriptional regulator